MSASSPWQERTLADEEWCRLEFGDLTLVIHSTREEWRVAALLKGDYHGPREFDHPPEDLPWERWDRAPEDTKLKLRPVFPDRPIIIRPLTTVNLSPRAKALFYVGIPAQIELAAESEGEYATLSSWPTGRLSNTWHGSPIEGILCYASKTHARRRFEPAEWLDYHIVCSIEISNRSSSNLPFERLFFDTDHLAIFEHDNRLWSNHARIRISEKEPDLNQVAFSRQPFGEAESGTRITPPREGTARRGIFKQAFSSVISTFQDD